MTRAGDETRGYRGAEGLIPRGFLSFLLLLGAFWAVDWLLRHYFGETRGQDMVQIGFCLFLGWVSVREIIDLLRNDAFATDGERRKVRLWSIAMLIAMTASATLDAHHLLFAPE